VTGKSLGIPLWMLQMGAGGAQMLSNLFKRENPFKYPIGTFFDEPKDKFWIGYGYNLPI
jgi:hypothetical protein